MNLVLPKNAPEGERFRVALTLAGGARQAARDGKLGRSFVAAVAFPINPQWLPAFDGASWERLQEIVQYRKTSKTIPAIPAIPPAPPSPPSPPDGTGPLVEIRPFTVTDLPGVLEVEHAAFPEFWWQSSDDFLRFGGGVGWTFDVMFLDGRLIGYNMNSASPPRGYVGRIGVHPAHQGQGFGHRLLAHALLRLYEVGCDYIDLTTQIENAQSRRLYEKFGFEAVGGHWLVMAKLA